MKNASNSPHLLLIDDDRWLLESMADWLRSEGFRTQTAAGIPEAKKKFEEDDFGLILCDVRLEDGDGMDLLRWMKKRQPQTPVLMMTGYAGPEAGSEAVAAGAFDLLTKPLIDQELLLSMRRAMEQNSITRENERLKKELDRRFGLENILGHDPRMIRIFDVIDSVADARASVLITGENGTGKSMIARAIHQRSNRRSRPFIEVACGALPDNLLESELFGHVAGAFTGATANKPGKFKLADTGTLFLDEIGTASQALQVKLLRVLQELKFEQLGGNETIDVDTRVVLATNDNLEKSVADGTFRQDLFYRVNVIRLELPPLRERRDDIPLLVEHFLQQAAVEFKREIDGCTPSALQAICEHTWPGNIRELENVVQRAVLLAKTKIIDVDLLPSSVTAPIASSPGVRFENNLGLAPSSSTSTPTSETMNSSPIGRPVTLDEALEEPERRIILDALRARNWNRNETAAALGINRTTLYKKIKKLGIEALIPV
jgi:DNA-binding NtrC family response regulator